MSHPSSQCDQQQKGKQQQRTIQQLENTLQQKKQLFNALTQERLSIEHVSYFL